MEFQPLRGSGCVNGGFEHGGASCLSAFPPLHTLDSLMQALMGSRARARRLRAASSLFASAGTSGTRFWKVPPRLEQVIDCLKECAFLTASVLFVVGTVYFFPQFHTDPRVAQVYVHRGCHMYNIGSITFMLLSTYSVVEGFYLRTSGSEKVRRKEILENFLYFLGSLIFLLGTLIWDQMETDESRLTSTFGGTAVGWAIAGVAFFGVGSFLFALAAFFNAMNLRCTP